MSDSRNEAKLVAQSHKELQPSGSQSQLPASRGGKRVESVQNLTDAHSKLLKSSKNKKEVRPLSGGVSKLIKGDVGKSRTGTANHN